MYCRFLIKHQELIFAQNHEKHDADFKLLFQDTETDKNWAFVISYSRCKTIESRNKVLA